MLPILMALWQTDATLQGAIEEQIQTSFVGAGSGAIRAIPARWRSP